MSRSVQDNFSGTCKKLIGARCTMKMVSAVVCVVPDTSTTMAVGSEPKGNG